MPLNMSERGRVMTEFHDEGEKSVHSSGSGHAGASGWSLMEMGCPSQHLQTNCFIRGAPPPSPCKVHFRFPPSLLASLNSSLPPPTTSFKRTRKFGPFTKAFINDTTTSGRCKFRPSILIVWTPSPVRLAAPPACGKNSACDTAVHVTLRYTLEASSK
ncbi:hypothetical protein E2C01_043397 [Portunus trituberculatus]|uniref:Uncharacterized protein n=1 Tax=Portunus trituberculatus TaxID=210409 RepID=A0A5B7FPD6_PORTR|nr:hypothetical protein [Portunus trituberculatus]